MKSDATGSCEPEKVTSVWEEVIGRMGDDNVFISDLLVWNPKKHSDDENLHWSWLRAVEWAVWPYFLSRLLAPLILIWFSWKIVVGSVLALNIFWAFIVRYKFVSVTAASIGADLHWTRWVSWPMATIFMFIQGRYPESWIALAWPALIFVPGFFIPTQVGRIQNMFMVALGYETLRGKPS